jgi:hypothetical protein
VRRNSSAGAINALGDIPMRAPLIAFALMIAVACSGYAFAVPQPLTRADCDKASMKWDEGANVCSGSKNIAAVVKKAGHGTKKYTYRKKAHHHEATAEKERGGFFKWLIGQQQKPLRQ